MNEYDEVPNNQGSDDSGAPAGASGESQARPEFPPPPSWPPQHGAHRPPWPSAYPQGGPHGAGYGYGQGYGPYGYGPGSQASSQGAGGDPGWPGYGAGPSGPGPDPSWPGYGPEAGPAYPGERPSGPGQASGWGGWGPPTGGWGPQGGGWNGGWQPRRRRARRAVAGLAAAGLLAVGLGAVVGHVAWGSGSSSPSSSPPATSPFGGGSGSGSGGSGSGGSGSGLPGSGGSGSGSGGSGGVVPLFPGSGGGSGSGGSGSGGYPYGGFGSANPGHSVSDAAGGPSNVRAIARKVAPGIVDIDTNLSYQGEQAAGTGMVLTSNGEILTNNHVVLGATSIRATDLGNGKTYTARVVGYSDSRDVAVLQLEGASGLKTINVGNSDTLKAGEQVVGVGNAYGVGGKPSAAGGAVSALNQSITASDQGGGHSERLRGLVQTNCKIQAGDSGGPLVTTTGQVVAMDTAASSNGLQTQSASSSSNAAFSIPIDQALSLARQIESGVSSSVIHVGPTAFLGVDVQPPGASSPYGTNPGSGSSGRSQTSGAEIAGVVPGSGAAKAGLGTGDIITSVDGHSVASPNALTTIMLGLKAGGSVPVTYVSAAGQHHTVTVHLGSGPPQ